MTPEQFLEFARVLPEALLMVNGDGQLLAGNQPAANLLGLRRQEFKQRMLFDLVIEPANDLIKYLQACSTSRAMILGTLTIRKNDGQTLICRSQGAVIQPLSSESSALILLRLENRATTSNNFVLLNKKLDELSKEIQRRKQAEEALSKANEELEIRVQERTKALRQTLNELQLTQAQLIQAEKMSSLGQMVAGIAHEVNNAINFVYGNLYYAQKYIEELLELVKLYQNHFPNNHPEIQNKIEVMDFNFIIQDFAHIFQSMMTGTKRIQEIVQSLRNFSRLDEADIKEVDIHEGIDSTLMMLKHRLEAKNECPEIIVIKEYRTIPRVTCYSSQINQVFLNILANAIDALEDSYKNSSLSVINSQEAGSQKLYISSPKIKIATDFIEDNWVTISIQDNGSGIDEQVRTKLFDPFFTTKTVGKGTGLGLSISYQIIVKKHSGQISCLSTPGKGTEFVIKIPINCLNKR
ncbi:PAS domain-containing sensor histidine kinase [Nostoc minutum NIES-26]|uniref:histidine kinase n=1 Tax=Nostoc minutum NIES-26 TaxID=1844469 RepID=A0A367QTF2_9NOSO|nr:PAS domain-containing sensor histidine kinase [Nostoc minutum NIES-26]